MEWIESIIFGLICGSRLIIAPMDSSKKQGRRKTLTESDQSPCFLRVYRQILLSVQPLFFNFKNYLKTRVFQCLFRIEPFVVSLYLKIN